MDVGVIFLFNSYNLVEEHLCWKFSLFLFIFNSRMNEFFVFPLFTNGEFLDELKIQLILFLKEYNYLHHHLKFKCCAHFMVQKTFHA